MKENDVSSGNRLELTSSPPKQAIPRQDAAVEKNDDIDVENVNLNIPNDSSSSAATLNGATDNDSFENDDGLAAGHGATTVYSEEANAAHKIMLDLMKPLQEKDKSISLQPELKSPMVGTNVSICACVIEQKHLVCHCSHCILNLTFQSAYSILQKRTKRQWITTAHRIE